MNNIKLAENKLYVNLSSLQSSDFEDYKNFIKSLNGARFNPKVKEWMLPFNKENYISLEKLNKLSFSEEVVSSAQIFSLEEKKILNHFSLKDAKNRFPTAWKFQIVGASKIERWKGRVLLADEMGLGKTLQSLIWLSFHKELLPVIIVCPSFVKYKWKEEIERWIKGIWKEDISVEVVSGKSERQFNNDITIINYDILSSHTQSLLFLNAGLIILDECHYAKNIKAKRTNSALTLVDNIPYCIAISGTPVLKRTKEMFAVLNALRPDLFANYYQFGIKFCDGKRNKFGWDFSGSSNSEELNTILSDNLMIRRLKKEVMQELPSKIKSIFSVEIENTKEYVSIRDGLIKDIKSKQQSEGLESAARLNRAFYLVEFTRLIRAAVRGKINSAFQWIDLFLESTDKKLVVISYHKEIMLLLHERYKRISVQIDGSISAKKKEQARKSFQEEDGIRILNGNLKSCKEGVEFHSASDMLVLEFGWLPGDLDQVEDRLHRIGQTRKVNINYIIAKDTIEEEVITLLDQARKNISLVLNGKEVQDIDLLSILLEKYKNM